MTRAPLPATAVLLLVLAAAATPPPIAPGEGCGCDFARDNNGWCEHCQVGYVAGVPICSQALHAGLDAHGHEIDRAAMRCPDCIEAVDHDGFCLQHRVGYNRGRLYATRLTWALARGMLYRLEDLTCDTCRANGERLTSTTDSKSPLEGWCQECQVGMVGSVAFCNRADYDAAIVEFRRLIRLNETAARCERCAGAQFFGTYCRFCDIRYDAEGDPISTGPNRPAASTGR